MKKIFIILIIFLILIAGFLFYYFYFPKEKPKAPQKKETLPPPPPAVVLPKVMYNLSGEIKKIESNAIIFEASIPVLGENNQIAQKKEIRKAIITPSTTFNKISFVEVEEKRKRVVESPITFKDLKIGDLIEAISNQDISHAEEFEATQIRLFPR
jgi:flagellar basal body-associated protein FliL